MKKPLTQDEWERCLDAMHLAVSYILLETLGRHPVLREEWRAVEILKRELVQPEETR